MRIYAEEQARREMEIREQKAVAEAERDAIFQELKQKEEANSQMLSTLKTSEPSSSSTNSRKLKERRK